MDQYEHNRFFIAIGKQEKLALSEQEYIPTHPKSVLAAEQNTFWLEIFEHQSPRCKQLQKDCFSRCRVFQCTSCPR
eukprot:9690412-Prorocentrum_lima.AAC.1